MWELILKQFEDKLTIILLISALVSFILALLEGEDLSWTSFVDPIVILTILILNAIVGVQQESSAEQAIAAIGKYSSPEAKVLRNGKIIKVDTSNIYPGDIIELSIGDLIPADARLFTIKSKAFRVDQAILTGESVSVEKITKQIDDVQAVKQDQINMVFSGTVVSAGHATAIVTATGKSTAIGFIHESIVSQIDQSTPLKEKLDGFGDQLAKGITIICILVWVMNIKNFGDPSHGSYLDGAIYYFKIAIALAVAAIPEGLSIVITTCLALGTKKMAKKNAIVRSLPSVETLGSTNVICSDKTGTLTTNQICVKHIGYFNTSDNINELIVSGNSFEPQGVIVNKDGKEISCAIRSSAVINLLAKVSSICNESQLTYDIENDAYSHVGEPTEAALKVLVEKLGKGSESTPSNVDPINQEFLSSTSKLATFEFSRDRKSMSVLIKSDKQEGFNTLLVKGAPESIIERSTSYCFDTESGYEKSDLSQQNKEEIQRSVTLLSSQGYRVLALAQIDGISEDDNLVNTATTSKEYLEIEQNLTFIGYVAMMDPPRMEVAESIRKCKNAGIRVIVITGDSQATAEAICRQIGIFDEDENVNGKSLTGRQFDNLLEDEKLEIVKTARLFSRVEPSHKSALVGFLQRHNNVVAMTGDGVNDAPALKKADIGIAMGSGTDVAKLAADLVLADDNFSTIEAAVEEGRAIYNNVRQFIRYLISSNIGEVVTIFLTASLGIPETLIPVQLLWVNLVTDGLPATALGFNPPDKRIMSRAPKPKDDPLISGWLFFRYLVVGAYVGAATVFGYVWWFVFYSGGPQITFKQLSHFHHCEVDFPELGCEIFSNDIAAHASTMSLSVLVIIEMLNAMNNLSEFDSLITFPLWNNPYLIVAIILSIFLHVLILYIPALNSIFSVTPLNFKEWIAVFIISSPVIFIDELFKLYEREVLLREPKFLVLEDDEKKKK